ncbi:MAG: UDP-glucose 4-epimerase, partial [Halieaceae bacterium]
MALYFFCFNAHHRAATVRRGVFGRVHCLVTGASGYIGAVLVPALRAEGHCVTAHTNTRAAPSEANFSLVGELDSAALLAALDGVDAVIHMAAIAHQRSTAAAYQRINVDATLGLAQHSAHCGVKRFIFLSSVKAATAQGRAERGVAAGSELRPMDYAGSKWAAEKGLQALCEGASMSLGIVRPALVYGPGALGHLAWLRRWVNARMPAPPVGGGRAMIARTDLVALLVRLLQAESGPHPVTLTDGEHYSVRRLHTALCRGLGRQPLLPSPPATLWHLSADALDLLRGEPRGSTWERLAASEPCKSS